tara:strand:- start:101566 stop:102405 length:840 start_codon:yes stop_codon:yes gene_type:complete
MKYSITLIIGIFFSYNTALAQVLEPEMNIQTPFQFGVIEELYSDAIQEKRILNIYLPEGYSADSALTYPVIYVLDGTYNQDFPHIAGLCQFLNMYQMLPKSIVVGIANGDRYRDFTYPSSDKRDKKDIPTSGGSPEFIQFVELELQPLINKKFKTNGHNTLIGQSLGGLVATEILMTKPQLFDDYIIVSPSLWWDNEKLVNKASSYFKMHQELNKRVYVSLGKEHPVMHKVADELVKSMRESGNDKLTVFYAPILDEDHATILHLAVYQAFKKLYPKVK